MKTFKLKSLHILERENECVVSKKIPLIDGLIIDREDEKSRWIVEAFTTNDFLSYFKSKKEQGEMIIQVKISKESNDPATFITSLIQLTEISHKISVLFMGTIVDQQISNIQEKLQQLIEDGYDDRGLSEMFKQLALNN